MAEFLRKLRALLQRDRINRDLQQEILTHIEFRTQEYIDRGLSIEEAQHLARRQFGNRTAMQESAEEAWAFGSIENGLHDFRYGIRALRRNRAFAVTVIFLIALGIGATSAVFSVVDRLLFRSLPYPDSDRLVSLGVVHPILDGEFLLANDYLYLRERYAQFANLTSWTGLADCDLTEHSPLRLSCAQVEANFLSVFGIRPILGRNFTPAEDLPEVRRVALISYGLWRSRFATDPKVIGQTISLDGMTTEIVGVLPKDFELPTLQHVDLVVPQTLKLRQYRAGETGRPLRVFGRLRDGRSVLQAESAIRNAAGESLAVSDFLQNAKILVRSVRDFQIQDVKLASWTLFGTTLTILLIICANVGNLLLARAAERRKEFAMRLALGASRSRLINHCLAENLLLAASGTIGGIALARTLVRVFKSIAPSGIPRIQEAALDSRVLGFSLLLALTCSVLLGLIPALVATRRKNLAQRGCGRIHYGARRTLMIVQIALSLILLSDAGLLLERLRQVTNVKSGMNATQVTTAAITVSPVHYPNSARRQQFFDELLTRLRANPLISRVAVSDTVPPYGFIHNRPLATLRVNGKPPLSMESSGMVSQRTVSSGYFATLGIPMLRGREFQESDRTSAAGTLVLSASLARRLFGEEEAVGKLIHFLPGGAKATVIGVAADVDNNGVPGHFDPEYYVARKKVTDPLAGADTSMISRALHAYDGEAFLLVRSAARSAAVAGWIRSETAAIDPTAPVTITTMQQRVRSISERSRFNAILMSLLALTGVALTASGLYGLVAFLVAQRIQELGVRVALGATPNQIAGLVIGDALRWTAIGTAAGLAGAILTAQAMRGIIADGGSSTLLLIVISVIVLLLVALAAAALPSLQASRMDPMRALRSE